MNNSLNIITRVFKSIFFNPIPNYAVIYVDGRCNMHCGFCLHAAVDARKTPIISPEKWGSIFKRAKSVRASVPIILASYFFSLCKTIDISSAFLTT